MTSMIQSRNNRFGNDAYFDWYKDAVSGRLANPERFARAGWGDTNAKPVATRSGATASTTAAPVATTRSMDYDTQDEAQGGQPDILGLVADWKSTAGSDSLPPLWGSSPKDVNRK